MADKTVISLPAQNETYEIPFLFTEAQVRANYSANIAGLANLVATMSEAQGSEGLVRTFTFTPRTGQKG